MGGCDIESRRVHDGMAREAIYVVENVLPSLECWCRRGRNIYGETVDILHKLRMGILNNTDIFENLGTEFSKVVLLQMVDICRGSR